MKPLYKVNMSTDFRNELAGIQRYITQKFYAPKEAQKIATHITNIAQSVAVFPKMYRVRKKDEQGRELRFIPVGNYVVVYSVDEEKQIIDVLHVIHGRRNIDEVI